MIQYAHSIVIIYIFIYSLIKDRILTNSSIKQLFISTHSLDFFKYLQGGKNPKQLPKEHRYFLIEKHKSGPVITMVPEHFKNNVTLFIFLFENLYIYALLIHCVIIHGHGI